MKHLADKLDELNKQNRAMAPKEALKIMDKATNDLKKQHFAENTLQVGDVFPDTALLNIKGNKQSISQLYKEQPLVITFYRGGWCPYCNMQLRTLQQVLPDFKTNGASLIAITPETPDNSLTTKEKNNLDFEVLSDIDNVFAKQIGLAFTLPEDLKILYNKFGLDVKKHNGNENFELPVPATFVVDKGGKIVYRFIDEDYTKRAEPSDILTALQKLKKEEQLMA